MGVPALLSGGNAYLESIQGNGQPLAFGITTLTYAGAGITPTGAQAQNFIVKCGGTNSAQENLVLPLTVPGACFFVINSGTGYGIQAIGSTGAGIVIANNKCAWVWTDGTNFYRMTLDSTITS